MENEKNIRAYGAWIAVCIIWGTTYLAIRIGVKDLPPALFAGLRWLIAGPILMLILWSRGYKLPRKKDLAHLAVVGIFLLGIGNGLVVFSEQFLPSGLTALLITTVPFWIVAIESFMPHGTRMNLFTAGGILAGFLGIILIYGNDWSSLLKTENLEGIIGLMLAVIGWSIGSVYSKYKKVDVHPLMGAAVEMVIAGIVLLLAALFLGEFSNFNFTPDGFYAFVYLIIIGSLLGYASYIYAIAHLPVSFVSTYAYINPIIALFLGWIILNETISMNIILATLIILAGVMMVKKGSGSTKLNSISINKKEK